MLVFLVFDFWFLFSGLLDSVIMLVALGSVACVLTFTDWCNTEILVSWV